MNWLFYTIIFLLILIGFMRNSIWHDDMGLWQDAASKSMNNARTLNNLCGLLKEKGIYDDAMDACNKSLKLEPESPDVHLNLWQIYKAKGMYIEAQEESNLGLKLMAGKPEAYNMLGYYLIKRGWFDEAIRIFKMAIEKKYDMTDSHYGLAASLDKRGDLNLALMRYKEYLRFANQKDSRFKEVEKRVLEIERGN